MKKIVLSLMFGLLPFTTLKAMPVNLFCMTEIATTSFIAYTEGETVTFKLIHHNGVEYMPVWDNLITAHDLPLIAEKAKVLSELGDTLEFTMPEKNCKTYDGMLMSCFGSEKKISKNGHEVVLWGAFTTENFEKSALGEYRSLSTTLSLEIDRVSYHLPMKYWDGDCAMGLSARKKMFLK